MKKPVYVDHVKPGVNIYYNEYGESAEQLACAGRIDADAYLTMQGVDPHAWGSEPRRGRTYHKRLPR